MIGASLVLWRALVHLYDESLLLIRANVVWFVGSIPLFLLVLVVSWLFAAPTDAEEGPILWPLLLTSFVLLVIPSPFATGIYSLAAEIVKGETPEFGLFWRALARWWKETVVMFLVGGLMLGGLIFNASFYLSTGQGWVQAISIVWLYGILYWITLQVYLLPLLVTSETTSLPALYKRAAILALANPIFSLVLLANVGLVMVLSAIAIPIYPLIAMAYVALVGVRALRHLREKYLPPQPEEAPE